jgi:hypothetical protein
MLGFDGPVTERLTHVAFQAGWPSAVQARQIADEALSRPLRVEVFYAVEPVGARPAAAIHPPFGGRP